MKIVDLYTPFIKKFQVSKNLIESLESNEDLKKFYEMASEWGMDLKNVETWLNSKEYSQHFQVAEDFIQNVSSVIEKVENTFGTKLKGEVKLSPSLMRFDGFARYDLGNHNVIFGVDHPDADADYLKVLMAHELSHVFRDHQPDVWGFLGKPLSNVSRQEYLDNTSGEEHLASEGLATLFSQVVYPDVPLHIHHYYIPDEMQWCLENAGKIGKAIQHCLKTDQNVWKFYEDDAVAPGSPSRVQYFWGALKIREWLQGKQGKLEKTVVDAHGLAAKDFECFH